MSRAPFGKRYFGFFFGAGFFGGGILNPPRSACSARRFVSSGEYSSSAEGFGISAFHAK
jgi:hypothetical protein